MKFLDVLKTEFGIDTSITESILATRAEKTQQVIKEAFAGEYVSKAAAADRINTDFINDKVAPKSIDMEFVKENKDYILSQVENLTEGDIKIIINNQNTDETPTVDYEIEGKKGKRGRPPKVTTAIATPPEAVTTDEPADEPEAITEIKKPVKKDEVVKKDEPKDEPVVEDEDEIVDEAKKIKAVVPVSPVINIDTDDEVPAMPVTPPEGSPEHEAGETPADEKAEDDEDEDDDEEKTEETEITKENKMSELRRPLKWCDIEKVMSKESVEVTQEATESMAEMLMSNRPLTWDMISRELFKHKDEKIKSEKGTETMAANGLTSEPNMGKAYPNDKQITDEKPNEKEVSKAPSTNALTAKTGINNSYANDKKMGKIADVKQPNLSGKTDAGEKKLTSMPGVKASYSSDKQIKPMK